MKGASAAAAAWLIGATLLGACAGHGQVPAGRLFTDCAGCPQMVTIPAGRFVMGSPDTEPERDPDESPQHQVSITAPFAISRQEITRGQFAAFIAHSGYVPTRGCRVWAQTRWEEQSHRSWQDPHFAQTDSHPVVCISWHDARAYARWLTAKTGKPYRLLTEAEWEYAARAQSTTVYFFGDDPDQLCATDNGHDQTSERAHPGMAWPGVACDDGFAQTAPVGSRAANPFGLYDVHGNVWEWLEDCYVASYAAAPLDGSAVVTHTCQQRVYRGGGWSVEKRGRRAANRARLDPAGSYAQLGLWVARDLP